MLQSHDITKNTFKLKVSNVLLVSDQRQKQA